ncbi:MAG: MutS-related protein [Symbiobacteriia bacterium]
MTHHSLLFTDPHRGVEDALEAPGFFVDLNLDQVVGAITAGRDEYNLKPFFYASLHDLDTIMYRQEIMRDLENDALLERIQSFAQDMHHMRERLALAGKLYYQLQKEKWFLDAVEVYCASIDRLLHDLTQMDVQSRGFLTFRTYLQDYTRSEGFASLLAESRQLQADLAEVQYSMLIKDNQIKVRHFNSEVDYSQDVEATFAKFNRGGAEDYRVKFSTWPEMNHVEAAVLNMVASLYPDTFAALDHYYSKHEHYLDDTVARFDREVQFYGAYLSYTTTLKHAGLRFCYPVVSESKEVHSREGFDLALADKLVSANSPIVCNDFYLQGGERIFVVSGPNQGGKTTFARTFGQLHYLASLGCPVPGREAQLLLFDKLLTHFEREENIKDLRGKLEDDLVRVHAILEQATPSSIVVMNEIFNSTALRDALFLSRKVMERIIELDLLCVWVTFIDELASLHPKIVSLVSTVVPENPAVRTFIVARRRADGLAYAMSVAERYGITYKRLKERISS